MHVPSRTARRTNGVPKISMTAAVQTSELIRFICFLPDYACNLKKVMLGRRCGRGSSPSRTIGSDLAFYLYGHVPRRWQSFGGAVNENPMAAGRGPDLVPARNGTAHVFKTGCPSLPNRSTGELVVLDEAGP